MGKQVTVYGISSCGTVKKARKWLDEQGIAHDWVDFRKAPVDDARVARWVEVLGAKAMRNTSGGAYRALGDEKKTWDDARWTTEFQADAMLIKRPVLEIDGQPAAVGFKQAAWEQLFGA